MNDNREFYDWLTNRQATEKAYVNMSNLKTQAQMDAEAKKTESAKPLEWSTHLKLGEAMKKDLGITATKDIYGEGVEAHGSPWKISGDKRKETEQWLMDKGFKKDGSYAWINGNFRVDIGLDSGTTYLYITDEEGKEREE